MHIESLIILEPIVIILLIIVIILVIIVIILVIIVIILVINDSKGNYNSYYFNKNEIIRAKKFAIKIYVFDVLVNFRKCY